MSSFDNYRAGLAPLTYYGGSSFMSNGQGGAGGLGAHTGAGAYGLVPGPIGVPDNRYTQALNANPAFAGQQTGANNLIASEQAGTVSGNTRNALTSAAAARGVARGMPGATDFTNNDLFANIAGYSENRQRQGLQDYQSLLAGTEAGMTDPNLATQIADRNSTYAAAPDPQQSAQQQLRNYLTALAAARGPGGGTRFGVNNPYSRGPGGGTVSAGVSGMPNLNASQPRGWYGTATSGSATDNPVMGQPQNYSGGLYQGNGLYGGTGYRTGAPGAPNYQTMYPSSGYGGDPWSIQNQDYYPEGYGGYSQGPDEGTGE